MLIAFGEPGAGPSGPREWAYLTLFPFGFSLGNLLGWRWPLLAGCVSLACLVASLIVIGRVFPPSAYLIWGVLGLPGVLYVQAGWESRKRRPGQDHRLQSSLVAVLILAATATVGRAQIPAPTPVNWSAEDSARVAFLGDNGQSYTAGGVIVWAPVDSLDPAWLSAFTDSLAVAVTGIRALIGGPFPWQRLGSTRVRFYLSPDRFVSHADGRGGVFISLFRVRQRDAPYLHEAAHELLVPPSPFYPLEYADSIAQERAAAAFPFWLSEGLPDYLAQRVAAATGFPEGDVFATGGLAKADSVCAARLVGTRRASEIRDRIGRPGRLEALFTTDRREVAPVYYACSQSFTAHLVERIGLPTVVALFPRIPAETWRVAAESRAGVPLEQLRREWLAALGLSPGPND